MQNKNYNSEFFSWYGTISKKDYIINILIIFVLYILLSFINFSAFEPYIPFKFILTILFYVIELFKLILIMCVLSLVYRRIVGISELKSDKFKLNMNRFFITAYVFPTLYFLCIRYFLNFIPYFIQIMDIAVLFVLMPIAFIATIIFCF